MKKLLFFLLLPAVTLSVSALEGTEGKKALVLSGGGGKGAYEIGVWKALSDLDVDIGGVYGASVGSINGAAVIMDDFERVRDLWLDTSYLSIMNISQPFRMLLQGNFEELSLNDYFTILKDLRKSGGIDVSPLESLLTSIISEDTIRSSNVDYGLVVFSVSSLEPMSLYIEQIPRGKLVDYILASANFPLFKRHELGGEKYIDGGVYSNIPIHMAVDRGFKDIIVVEVGIPTPVDILNSLTRDSGGAVRFTRIKPREQYGTVLTFEREVSRKYLLEGYLDTMKVYGRLQGNNYYIYGSEDVLRRMFACLNMDERSEALSILDVKDTEDRDPGDVFSEVVVPVFEGALLDIFPGGSEDVSLVLLERLAGGTGVEPLALYTREELLEAVLEHAEEGNYESAIAEELISLRFSRILDFLRFLDAHCETAPPVPEGYADFREGYSGLLE